MEGFEILQPLILIQIISAMTLIFGVESKADQKMYYLTIICWHEQLPEMRLVLSSLQPLSSLQSLYDIL